MLVIRRCSKRASFSFWSRWWSGSEAADGVGYDHSWVVLRSSSVQKGILKFLPSNRNVRDSLCAAVIENASATVIRQISKDHAADHIHIAEPIVNPATAATIQFIVPANRIPCNRTVCHSSKAHPCGKSRHRYPLFLP